MDPKHQGSHGHSARWHSDTAYPAGVSSAAATAAAAESQRQSQPETAFEEVSRDARDLEVDSDRVRQAIAGDIWLELAARRGLSQTLRQTDSTLAAFQAASVRMPLNPSQ